MADIISLGAGVQSSGLALMAAQGLITPMPDCAIFADTQDEPPSVYVWLDWLEKQLPFPVYRVTTGRLSERALRVCTSKKTGLTYLKHSIPVFMFKGEGMKRGIMPRHCTADFKLTPIFRQVRQLYGRKPVRMWIGISTDEAHRMKPSQKKNITNVFPLIDRGISRAQVIRWFEERGYPKPPRSACVFCPYHSDAEWARIKREEPESFKRAVEFEQQYQDAVAQVPQLTGVPFLHDRLKPLASIDFDEAAKTSTKADQFGNECEGMCGV